MTDAPDQRPDDFDLPAGLRADLRSLYGHNPAVPAEVDRAILRAAPAHLAKGRRLRLFIGWAGAAAAVAAALLIALQLMPSTPRFREGQRVTILDAFSLARQLKANAKPDKSWDVNHDGRIDQADVDVLAARAVALPSTGGGK